MATNPNLLNAPTANSAAPVLTLAADYTSMVQILVTGGSGRGVTPTAEREVLTAAAGETVTYTLSVQAQDEFLLVARQDYLADPYTSDATLSLAIDGQTIFSDFPLTEGINLPGEMLPPARHAIVYTLVNNAPSGTQSITIDTFGAVLNNINAAQITRLLQANYLQLLTAGQGA